MDRIVFQDKLIDFLQVRRVSFQALMTSLRYRQIKDEAAAIMALACGDSPKAAGKLWDRVRQCHGEACIEEAGEALLALLESNGPGASVSHANAISALGGAAHCEWEYGLPDQFGNAENLVDWILRNTEARDVADETYLAAWDICEELFEYFEGHVECLMEAAQMEGRHLEGSMYLSSLLRIALKDTSGSSSLAQRAVDLCVGYINCESCEHNQEELAEQVVTLLRRGVFTHQALYIMGEILYHTVGSELYDFSPWIVRAGGVPLLVSLLNPLSRTEAREEIECFSTDYEYSYDISDTLTGAAAEVLHHLLGNISAHEALQAISGDFCERLMRLIGTVDARKQACTFAGLLKLLTIAILCSSSIAAELRHMGALTKIKGLPGIRYSDDVIEQASEAFASLIQRGQAAKDDAFAAGVLEALVGHLKDAKDLKAKACATQATYGSDWLPYLCPPADEATRQAGRASKTREAVFRCLNEVLLGANEQDRSTNAEAVVNAGILPLLMEFLAENDLNTWGWIVLGRIAEAETASSAIDRSGVANAVIRGLQSVPKLLNGYCSDARRHRGDKECNTVEVSNKVGWCLAVANTFFPRSCEELTDRGLVPALIAAINATVSLIPVDAALSLEDTSNNPASVLKELLVESGVMLSKMSDSSKSALLLQLISGGTAALLLSWNKAFYDTLCKTFIDALRTEVCKVTESPGLLLSITSPDLLDGAMVGLAAASAACWEAMAPTGFRAQTNDVLCRPGFSTAVAQALLCGNRQGMIARMVFSKYHQTQREEWSESQCAAGVVGSARDLKRKEPGAGNTSAQGNSSGAKRHCARREDFNVESFDSLKLVVGGKPFYGHGAVLKAASETLRVALQDVTPSAVPIPLGEGPASVPKDRLNDLFCAACEHAYFGTVPGLGLEGPIAVMELREVAQWLQMPALLEECNLCLASALHKAETAESAAPIVESLFEELISEGVLPPVYIKDIGGKARGAPSSNYFVPGGAVASAFVGALLRWGNDKRVAKILVEGMGGGLDKPRKARCAALLSGALGEFDGFHRALQSMLQRAG